MRDARCENGTISRVYAAPIASPTPQPPIPHPSSLISYLLSLLLSILLLPGCAGYQIGNQALFPETVHTVYVPVFQSNSFRRNIGERLTEAVVKEIEKRTPYKVIGDPSADSILSGNIISENKHALVHCRTGDARESEVDMIVQVSWMDRKGVMIRDRKNVPLPEELVGVNGTSDIVPEVGQSVATAQQEAICKMARQIVDLMEKPW
jgi:hypothetical protein